MSAEKLAQLNTFRVKDGKEPLTVWKGSRSTLQLQAYIDEAAKAPASFKQASADELNKQRTRPSVQLAASSIAQAAADAMRPGNEALGDDIKHTRAAWKASGANTSKKLFALDLLTKKKGSTIKNMVDRMGITNTAARSLIGDLRRMAGVTITREKDVYFATKSDEDADEESGE